ncbi:hypothetical protein MKX01_007847 [Papaver californicum]|nr:hypothetical protein MKX01_007847 [Papaver californicum]
MGINHRMVDVNGIKMHIAEEGQGPVVLLVHGFPSLWYSWRHQILSLAASGYRAVALDLRCYGDTDAPTSPRLIHVFVVGHDWGAIMSWYLCLFRPDKIKALVNLSVAFTPRNPKYKPIETMRAVYGDDYYMIRFQEPGEMEAECANSGTKTVLTKILSYTSPAPLMVPKDKGFTSNHPVTLPSWLLEEDICYYSSKFEKSGFTGPFNYYRNMNVVPVKIPVKFMVGDQDLSYHIPGVKEYIHSGRMRKDVPFLQEVVVLEGVGHFIMEERADEISNHIVDFLQRF